MIQGFRKKTIYQKSLGEKLKSIRLRKDKSLIDAEEITKVRYRYLEAFERDDIGSLPGMVYAVGFLQRYMDFLEIQNQELYLTDFKRSFSAWESFNKHKLTPKRSVKETKLIITPKLIFSSFASLLVIALTGYIWLQVNQLTSPPTLEIITPSESTKVAIEMIEISGKADPGSVVSINNQVITQDTTGKFSEKIALDSGLNTIEVIAKNRFNKQTSKTINVLRTSTNDKQEEKVGENGTAT